MFAETLKYCRFFAEKDNSPGKTMVEGKARGGSSVLRYYQSIAALLTVSKIQRLRHRDESDALPMVIVSPTDVVILVYQPETDTLIITQVLPWEKVAYFFLWVALHHSIFPIKIPVAVECGYRNATLSLPYDDYWYLRNRRVLQGNRSEEITTTFTCTYMVNDESDRTK